MKFFARLFPGLKQYSLSYRLLVYVVLCSSFFALLATATQLYLDYRRDVSALHESFSFIQKSYLQTIAASTFKIDSDLLRLELEGALKLPDIVYLEVRELRGNQIYTHAHGNSKAAKIIRKEFPLEYISPSGEKRLMGTLVVNASLEGVYQRLWSRVLTILVTNMVKTFLASACILAIIYLLIARHLLRMASYTQSLAPGTQHRLLTLNRRSRETHQSDELEHVVIAINDLQERVAADIIKQRQAELKYRTVADFTYDWEYWANFNGKLHYVSPSCERISSYAAQEFIDNPSLFREIIVSEDREIWDQHYHDSREEFTQRELQFRIQRRDGTIRWIEHACQPVYDDQGNPLGFRASNRDITERKLAEIDLRSAYTKIEQLKNQLEAETVYLQEEIKLEHNFESIIGNSAAVKYTLFKIEQVADTDTAVLVLGETGTGKELVARAIHKNSLRQKHPLVKVNCATLPSNLIESELFGHETGAFTGAQKRQVGRFEVANGTSIFLDEIGELPMELQTKLLGVLQDGEFQRLGSSRTMQVDVRVIAATNRDLEAEVRQGRFREDLFYRLNVFPVTVPPLRERTEDIPLLTEFFVEKASKRLGKGIELIPTSVMNTFQKYPWPGNVRELENVIERAVISSSGPKLRLADDLNPPPQDLSTPLKTLETVEFDHIVRVLEHTDWKVSGKDGAAGVLGLKRGTLRARMQKLGIRKR
jgi:PAS domain S-box-containing protein